MSQISGFHRRSGEPDLNSRLGIPAGAGSNSKETHNDDGSTTVEASEDVNGQTIHVKVSAATEEAAVQGAHDALASASQATAGQTFNSASGSGSLLPTGNEPPGVTDTSVQVVNDQSGESSAQRQTFSSGHTTDTTGRTLPAGALASNETLDVTRQSDGTFSAAGTGQALGTLANATSVTGSSASAVLGAAKESLDANLAHNSPQAGSETAAPGVSSITAVTGSKTGSTASAQGAIRTYDSQGRAGAQQLGAAATVTDPAHALGLAVNQASKNVASTAASTGATGSTGSTSASAQVRADAADPNVQDGAMRTIASQQAKPGSSPAAYAAAMDADREAFIQSHAKDPNNISSDERLALNNRFTEALKYAIDNQPS